MCIYRYITIYIYVHAYHIQRLGMKGVAEFRCSRCGLHVHAASSGGSQRWTSASRASIPTPGPSVRLYLGSVACEDFAARRFGVGIQLLGR